MQTNDEVFQLEQFVPGAFLTQGLTGGLLAGFAFIFALTLWTDRPDPTSFLVGTPLVMIGGGTAGVIMAAMMWAAYRLFGIEMRLAARVMLTVITIRVITMFVGLRWGVNDQTSFTLGIAIALLTGLPMALLVGSVFKPWELFTFGSIAVGPVEIERRAGSYSVLGTLGSLPLRFMGIGALAAWFLFVSCQREMNGGVMGTAAALLIPAIYPAFSAYVTFRSPHKGILLVIGLVVNIPVSLIALFGAAGYKITYWFDDALFHLGGICTAFLIAWAIFLIARLNAQTRNPVLTLDDFLASTAKTPVGTFDRHYFGASLIDDKGRLLR